MSSILNSQGMVLATAMAVSGTVILLALRLQKTFPATQFPFSESSQVPTNSPRSCISSDGKRGDKKKKRVHFAKDVVDPSGNSEEFRRQHSNSNFSPSSSSNYKRGGKDRGMPANRMALYNGILRDRVVHRTTYSY